jgi:hypothetical protein
MVVARIPRSKVKPGKTFFFNENRVPCVAIADTVNTMLKGEYVSRTDRAWHVYTPTGNISWTGPETMVLIPVGR